MESNHKRYQLLLLKHLPREVEKKDYVEKYILRHIISHHETPDCGVNKPLILQCVNLYQAGFSFLDLMK